MPPSGEKQGQGDDSTPLPPTSVKDDAVISALVKTSISSAVTEAVAILARQTTPPEKVLTKERVEASLSNLGWTADGDKQAMLDCNLENAALTDVGELIFYKHLQKINLSSNFLSSVSSCLSMVDLVHADFSRNRLSDIDLANSNDIRFLDISGNDITSLSSMENHPRLRILQAHHNSIASPLGLRLCAYLKVVNLSFNNLKTLKGIAELPALTSLNVSNNRLKSLDGVEKLTSLTCLDASHNKVSSLAPLEPLLKLQELSLQETKVREMDNVTFLQTNMPFLTAVDFFGSPIQASNLYRESVLFRLPTLTLLDGRKVSSAEKARAVETCCPPPRVIAAKNHAQELSRRLLSNNVIGFSTLASGGANSNYPVIVVAGHHWSTMGAHADKILKAHRAILTPMPLTSTNQGREGVMVVSEAQFEEKQANGAFFFTFRERDGSRYGLEVDSLDDIAARGLIPLLLLPYPRLHVLRIPGLDVHLCRVPVQTHNSSTLCMLSDGAVDEKQATADHAAKNTTNTNTNTNTSPSTSTSAPYSDKENKQHGHSSGSESTGDADDLPMSKGDGKGNVATVAAVDEVDEVGDVSDTDGIAVHAWDDNAIAQWVAAKERLLRNDRSVVLRRNILLKL